MDGLNNLKRLTMENKETDYISEVGKKVKVVEWLINLFDLEFSLIQYKFYRKWKGGTFYLIWNWLPMNPFWSRKLITSCGGRAIKTEIYKKTNKL
jgi:hypothetical protein